MSNKNIEELASEERIGKDILKRRPLLLKQLESTDDLYIPEFLKYIGLVKKHTKSVGAALQVAETALKYRSYHPRGGKNAASNIAENLEHISYHTESKDAVINSAITVENSKSPKEANKIADELGWIAIQYVARDCSPADRFYRASAYFVNFILNL